MDNDFIGIASALGIGMFIISLIIYVGIIALTLWIGYVIIRTAVKNGILRADEERARRHAASSPLITQQPR